MKNLLNAILLCAMISVTLSAYSQNSDSLSDTEEKLELSPEEQAQANALAAQEFWQSLSPKNGLITIPSANANLMIPEEYVFLDANDAEAVLVDAWGNMPSTTTLGMIMPAGVTPFDQNAWAVTIEYQADGYVSDEEAENIDYSDLLNAMKKDMVVASESRVEQGYESIELIGWASQPYYDKSEHKLHWAKELNFGGYEQNTLNYDIRILGRSGVLVMSFIADMHQKSEIDAALPEVLALASFEEGEQYADFNPATDNYAAYGLGALISGKVLAKTSFFTVLIVLLKKFGVFILVGVGALVKGIFSRKKSTTQG